MNKWPSYQVTGPAVLDFLGQAGPYTDKMMSDAAYAPLKVVPVLIAIFNGYIWNSLWTFRVAEKKLQAKLVFRFYVIALAAMVVNIGVGTLVKLQLHIEPGKAFWIANVIGMIVAAFVNFMGQRQWTFRGTKRH